MDQKQNKTKQNIQTNKKQNWLKSFWSIEFGSLRIPLSRSTQIIMHPGEQNSFLFLIH